ncbi:hypothetical protein C8R44DRAFT_743119 [Mycena epipterygia]|nr:hypothetical protein C8R44DRAFT_743119 [Mycena epipterygia]
MDLVRVALITLEFKASSGQRRLIEELVVTTATQARVGRIEYPETSRILSACSQPDTREDWPEDERGVAVGQSDRARSCGIAERPTERTSAELEREAPRRTSSTSMTPRHENGLIACEFLGVSKSKGPKDVGVEIESKERKELEAETPKWRESDDARPLDKRDEGLVEAHDVKAENHRWARRSDGAGSWVGVQAFNFSAGPPESHTRNRLTPFPSTAFTNAYATKVVVPPRERVGRAGVWFPGISALEPNNTSTRWKIPRHRVIGVEKKSGFFEGVDAVHFALPHIQVPPRENNRCAVTSSSGGESGPGDGCNASSTPADTVYGSKLLARTEGLSSAITSVISHSGIFVVARPGPMLRQPWQQKDAGYYMYDIPKIAHIASPLVNVRRGIIAETSSAVEDQVEVHPVCMGSINAASAVHSSSRRSKPIRTGRRSRLGNTKYGDEKVISAKTG